MDLAAQAGLYLHVPFCSKKCAYCSFYSFVPQAEDMRRYIEAVRLQMRQLAGDADVRTLSFASVFFGGGTPSTLPVEVLAALLADCRELFSFAGDAPEITIEVNPGTVDAKGLQQLRRAGFNRLSIGIQSFADQELQQMGRIHTSGEAQATIEAARSAGFDNLSFDLMYGLPGQSVRSWQETLDRALAIAPEHLSLYELTVEEGTPFFLEAQQRQWALPSEDAVLAMMAATETAVESSPLGRYEISNYAVAGRQCRHNLNYWHNGLYLGFGPGAVSAFGGQRRATVADLPAFRERMRTELPVWVDVERLDREAAFRETVIMGLRLLAGVSITDLGQRFGLDAPAYYGPILERLVGQGLLALQGDRLFLTRQGLPLANQVMAQLV
jgi:oxygen-independent coproporphyrinogen-3 oxidase